MTTPPLPSPEQSIRAENAELRKRLEESEVMLRSIRAGEVDARLVESAAEQLRSRGELLAHLSASRDVTERKRGEEERREALLLLDTLLDRAPVGFAYFDRELRYLRINERLAEINGLSAAEHLGRTVEEVVPTMAAEIREVAERMAASGQPVLDQEFTGEMASAPGVMRHWNVNWFPVHSERREITGFGAVVEEITGRKNAEKALHDSEQHYRALATASSEVVYRMSADWSSLLPLAGRELVVSSTQTLTDWAWLEQNVPPEDHPRLRQAIGEAIARKCLFELEHRVRRPDGSIGWTFSRAVPIFDENGELTAWFGAASDITERKHTEQALRASEARFRAAVGAVSSLIWTNNARGEMEGEQPGWGGFTGQSREEYQGHGWALAVHPEDAEPTIDAWHQAVAEKRMFEFEHRLRRHDGEWRVCIVRAVPVLGESGEIYEWVGVHTDITERQQTEEALRQSEARFRGILRQSPAGIVQTDATGCMTLVNERWCEMFGYSEAELLGRSVVDVTHPSSVEQTKQNVARLAAGGPDFQIEKNYCRKDGSHFPAQSNVSAVRSPTGEYLGLVAVVVDMTERLRTEDALRRTNERFELALTCSQVVLFQQDLELRYTWIQNPALGYDALQVIGKLDRDLFERAEDAAMTEGLKLEVIRAGVGVRQEVRVQFQGVERHYDLSVEPLRNAAGLISGVTCAAIDITTRKAAEEKLRTNEHRLRLTLEAAATGLWDWDVQTDVVTWSAESYPIHGLKEGEFDGTAEGFDRLIHPDDRSRVWATVRAAVDGRKKYYCEFRIVRPGGEVRWVANTGRAVHEHAQAGKMVGTITDITERKEAEEAVARLAAIVESSHDALFGEDLDGIITSWNRGAEQIFGYRAEEIVGTSIMRLIPADRQAAEYELQRQIVAGELGGTFETIRLTKDGREFPASITVAPLKDAAGKVMGTSRVVRDITERTQTEEALRESEERFRDLADNIPQLAWIADAGTDGRVRWFNKNWFEYTGTTLEQMQGIGWHAVHHPDHAERVIQKFSHHVKEGEDWEDSFPLRGKDGKFRWFLSRMKVIRDESGAVVRIFGTNTDITERTCAEEALRASQERMSLAAEATGVGIWEWNVVTNVVRWDAVMFSIYGITPTPDGIVQYSDWSGAVLPEDWAETAAILQETVRQCGQSTRSFRIRRRSDGECRHIEAVETVRADTAGKAAIVVGTNLDVTERVQAEQAILDAAEKAVAANEAKDRFLAALSHELRTPLTPVLLVSGVHAKSKKLSDDLREDFQMIHRNVVLEAQLIDDLLDVSRIQQGKMRFDFKPVDVHEAIARSLEMLRSEVEEKGITVRQKLHATPAMIEADPTRLRQVLVNLLRNAVKFTPHGGTITLLTAREPGDLQISVIDTGAGIPAEDLQRIFEAFEQVEHQQKSEYRSLGLGLAISASIVAAHRGRIWAESPGPDQGATFHVRIPC